VRREYDGGPGPNPYWKPRNSANGNRAHDAFNEWQLTIGYAAGREIPWPAGHRLEGSTGITPDGFTPDGAPVELKSGHALHSKASRRQLHKAISVLDAQYGEMWLWVADSGNFRFTLAYRMDREGNVTAA